MQAITQAAIETARAVAKAITEATNQGEGSSRDNTIGNAGPKAGRSQLRHPTFNWSAKHKNHKLKRFEMDMRHFYDKKLYILMQKKYSLENMARQRGPPRH